MPLLLSGNWDHIIKQPIQSIFMYNHEPLLLDLCISILISNVSLWWYGTFSTGSDSNAMTTLLSILVNKGVDMVPMSVTCGLSIAS